MTDNFSKKRTLNCRIRRLGVRAIPLFAAFATTMGAWATPAIEIDSVIQRWPWNNKVDITYTVTDGQTLCQDVSGDVYCRIVFNATIDGQTYEIDGVTNIGASAASGTHTVTWLPPAGIRTTNCVMSAALYSANAPSGDDYMILDLASGAIVYEGLLASQELSNARYNTTTYKTTKMVLRKIAAGGSYWTGSSTYSGRNSVTNWVTDLDYYVGVFPVTQSQYVRLGLANPSNYATDSESSGTDGNYAAYRPVEKVSWYDLRGTGNLPSNTIDVVHEPNTGTFFQRLRYLTGNVLDFDLPTEVMLEIAIRAGTTSTYWWGDNVDATKFIGKDYPVSGNATTWPVGTAPANTWGLFDMAGNVFEWCRDDPSRADLATAPDPWTAAFTEGCTQAMIRCGDCGTAANSFQVLAAHRSNGTGIGFDKRLANVGFRVAVIMR